MKLPVCRPENDEDSEFKQSSKSNYEEQSTGSSKQRRYCEMDASGKMICRELTPYECKLEDEVEQLQDALFTITSHYAKIQFRLRQISSASGCERLCLLKELERLTSQGLDAPNPELPSLLSDSESFGNVRVKQHKIIKQLRGRLQNLAQACFQTESGACYNRNPRCRCWKERRGENDFEVPNYNDQDCHCCVCKKEEQGKKTVDAGKRFLAETWSETDYGEEDFKQRPRSKSKKHKKVKKERKLVPTEDFYYRGKKSEDKSSKYSRSTSKGPLQIDEKKRRSANRTPSRSSSIAPIRVASSASKTSHQRETLRKASSKVFVERPSKQNHLRTPSKASSRSYSEISSKEGLRRVLGKSQSQPQYIQPNQRPGARQRGCSPICRVNRTCQRKRPTENIYEEYSLRRQLSQSESALKKSVRGNKRSAYQSSRSGDDVEVTTKKTRRKRAVYQTSESENDDEMMHKINYQHSRNGRAKPAVDSLNQSLKGNGRDVLPEPAERNGARPASCSCPAALRSTQFPTSEERPSTSKESNQPNLNKPPIVENSKFWNDIQEEKIHKKHG